MRKDCLMYLTLQKYSKSGKNKNNHYFITSFLLYANEVNQRLVEVKCLHRQKEVVEAFYSLEFVGFLVTSACWLSIPRHIIL